MKKVRDLEFLLAQLRALRDRNDTEPEQTKNIDDAIELVRQLRRKSHPTGPEVRTVRSEDRRRSVSCVREVSKFTMLIR